SAAFSGRSQRQRGRSAMSIFGSIMNAIFKGPAKATEAASAAVGGGASPAATSGASASTSASAPASQVDVAAVLPGLAPQSKEKLDWRKSIVDLMKLLKLDSSLTARKELATELHYSGDMNDSAAMNIWLHKQVMQKLAENGGKVPDDLKHS